MIEEVDLFAIDINETSIREEMFRKDDPVKFKWSKEGRALHEFVNDEDGTYEKPAVDYKDPFAEDHGIAGEAHSLVYGARAKTYGHPRFDFTSIGTVWTGLLQDLLKPGTHIDPHRVAVLMTGLKLARLVKSPTHHDSRVDTIGYMLTMERLDEPSDDELARADAAAADDSDVDEDVPVFYVTPGQPFHVPPGVTSARFIQRRLKTYQFPVESPDDPQHFSQKTIEAFTVGEAQQKFDAWKKLQDKGPVLNPLTGKPLKDGEVVASLGKTIEVQPQYEDDELTSPTETVNPSDGEVQVAMDILRRRQQFHDQEAHELLRGKTFS